MVPIDQTKSVTNNLPNNQRINQDIRRLRKELSKVMNMRKIKRDYQKQSAAEGATTLMDLLAKSGAIDSEEGKKKARITDRKKMERMVHSIAFRATNSVTSRNSRSIPLPEEEERSQKKGASSVGKSAIGRSPRSKGGKGGSGSGSGTKKTSGAQLVQDSMNAASPTTTTISTTTTTTPTTTTATLRSSNSIILLADIHCTVHVV